MSHPGIRSCAFGRTDHSLLRRIALTVCLAAALCLSACHDSAAPAVPAPPSTPPTANAAVRAEISDARIVLVNGLVARSWTRTPYRTERLLDLRSGRVWTEDSADFVLEIAGMSLAADQFSISGEPELESIAGGGLRLTLTLVADALSAAPGLRVIRSVLMYPGIAGMRQETRLEATLPQILAGYTLDQTLPAGVTTAQMHSFRAGADWREPEWSGPPLMIGDAQTGTWRRSTSGSRVSGSAQWLSLADAADQRLFHVLERNDLASSVVDFDGERARAGVDLSRDVIYLGPLEESAHVGNPGSGPGRTRLLLPGQPLQLEAVFTGVGLGADDEPWQHYKYLSGQRMPPYRREVTFNSNGVDANVISTGAKDDLNFEAFLAQLEIAKVIGIETFIFDDGWQARSGDWCPDADVPDERCHDPRRGSDPKFAARFPDAEFNAVQALLRPAGIKLGLWMSPMHFNPSALAFRENPQWMCLPISAGLLLVNQAQPDEGSNEAGIVQWNPLATSASGQRAIDHIEARLRIAITEWGVRYFKFDFTAWFDCVGVPSVDMYGYREAFMAMLDRLIADHPDVTLQMDETNDYRLFPFEALARGPTWYQNGSPKPNEALHANHVLAPYLPLFALGRNALRAGDLAQYSVDYQMAVALLSHISFFNDLTKIPTEIQPRIRIWTDYYRAHRQDLAAFAYPLLEEDPVTGDNWAAFQTWDPEQGRGALLVYRQESDESLKRIRLRNVPAGSYRLYEAPDESRVQLVTAEALRAGIEIEIPAPLSARVFRIERQ